LAVENELSLLNYDSGSGHWPLVVMVVVMVAAPVVVVTVMEVVVK
jgi:hypothetical protein